jgi:hypothetical protein
LPSHTVSDLQQRLLAGQVRPYCSERAREMLSLLVATPQNCGTLVSVCRAHVAITKRRLPRPTVCRGLQTFSCPSDVA